MECIIVNLLVMAIGTFAVVQFKDLKETAATFTTNKDKCDLEECNVCVAVSGSSK